MGFSFVSWIVMSIFVFSVRFFSSCIFVVSPLMFICIIVMVFLEFICCWVMLLLIECGWLIFRTEEDGQIGTNHSLPLERGALFSSQNILPHIS